jgi:hypothetical protein
LKLYRQPLPLESISAPPAAVSGILASVWMQLRIVVPSLGLPLLGVRLITWTISLGYWVSSVECMF